MAAVLVPAAPCPTSIKTEQCTLRCIVLSSPRQSSEWGRFIQPNAGIRPLTAVEIAVGRAAAGLDRHPKGIVVVGVGH
jgi:hypothetical protein